jgi:hypothetical protein
MEYLGSVWPYVLMGWPVPPLFLAVWASLRWPDKTITGKYAKRQLAMAKWPFGDSWRVAVVSEDQPRFEGFRNRFKFVYLYLFISGPIILFLGIFPYFYGVK